MAHCPAPVPGHVPSIPCIPTGPFPMKLFLGSDHAGFELKEHLTRKAEQWGHEIRDFGVHSPDSTDYPDIAHPLATALLEASPAEFAALGLLICGSANGVAMAANKHPGIRAAIAWQPELASLARAHNDANILCLPARFISTPAAEACLSSFLETPFEGGRHQRRVSKIPLRSTAD